VAARGAPAAVDAAGDRIPERPPPSVIAHATTDHSTWMAVHIDKTIQQRRKNYDNRTALVEEEEQILKCLGAAVLLRWNTVPTKLQRELFDCASTIGDLQQTTPKGTDSSLPSQL
jgi:hypothetical protein